MSPSTASNPTGNSRFKPDSQGASGPSLAVCLLTQGDRVKVSLLRE